MDDNRDVSSPPYRVYNVNIHFKVPFGEKRDEYGRKLEKLPIPSHLPTKTKKGANMTTVNSLDYKYVVFPKSGHVNASRIANFDNINKCVDDFNTQFNANIAYDNITVDNSTACGRLKIRSILHCNLQDKANSVGVTVSTRPYCFPSTTIRPKLAPGETKKKRNRKKLKKDTGTIVLFNSGKYNIVGCKSLAQIARTYSILCVLTASTTPY